MHLRILTVVVAASLVSALLADDVELGLRLPLTIDADSSEFDGIAGTMIYRGLRFSQGNISIEAAEGRATATGKNDGRWYFSGDVVIVVDQGRIECETANLVFDSGILTTATVTGSPASFEMRREGNDDTTTATAGRLHYDVTGGLIEFTDDVNITEAGNQISSNKVVYNIAERRIRADSSDNGEDRVRITYTPKDE